MRNFPHDAIERAGYGAVWRGQKTWNGVAILARGATPIVTRTELPGDPADTQSRYIEAAVNGVLIASLYAPNGNPQPGPKFDYKLAWLERLAAHAAELYAAGVPVVLAGDYNVVPTERDIYPTKSWAKDALVQPESRAAFRRILEQGWVDAIRTLHPDAPMYTFWDYMRNRWARDAGLRLDHLLLSAEAAKRLADAGVDRDVRGERRRQRSCAGLDRAARCRQRRDGLPRGSNRDRQAQAPAVRAQARPAKRNACAPALAGDRRRLVRAPLLSRVCRRRSCGAAASGAGAILGFANFLLRLYQAEQPRAVLVGWDTLDAPTYRHQHFPAYQSGREFDDALLEQLDALPEFVAACGFANAKAAGLRGR